MKKVLLALLLIYCGLSSRAQLVQINDANFLYALNQTVPSCISGNWLDTSCAEVQSLTEFSCAYCGIQDIEGIQGFPSLTKLDLLGNEFPYLPDLPQQNLLYLDVSVNPNLVSVNSFPATLTELHIEQTPLTGLPAFPAGLTKLSIGGDLNVTLDTVPPFPSGLTSLFIRSLGSEPIPTLPSGLVSLTLTGFTVNPWPTWPPNLRDLDVSYLSNTTLPALPPSLKFLQMEGLPLTTMPAFPNNITNLYMNYMDYAGALPALPDSLVQLSIVDLNISALPALPTTQFDFLQCIQDSFLTAWPAIPQCVHALRCTNCDLQSLPTLPSNLNYLNLYGNTDLALIPPLPNTLNQLEVSHTGITSLPPLPGALRVLQLGYTSYIGELQIPTSIDSLFILEISHTPNLTCLSYLPKVQSLSFASSALVCWPNIAPVINSTPAFNTKPVCTPFNSAGCSVKWNISGQVYYGTGCSYNNSYIHASGVKMLLFENGNLLQQTFTAADGAYSFDTDHYGTYTVVPDTTAMPYTILCPAAGFRTSVITAVDSMDTGFDFTLNCKPGFDVQAISVVPSHGFQATTTALVRINAGYHFAAYPGGISCAAAIPGQVKVVISGPVSFNGFAGGYYNNATVNADTLIWSFSNLATLNVTDSLGIFILTDTTALLGDMVCFYVTIMPGVAGDYNPANNTLQYCLPVVASFDPNDKAASPVTALDTVGYMTYLIRFQNTGNAPALHVRVIDTLDSDLDPSTFELLDYSHANNTQLFGNVVKFNFPNINLPDSFSNEPASHGYVQYRIKTKHGLPPTATVKNTAYIYFDFNAPVVTNTVENAFGVCATTYGNIVHSMCSGDVFTFNGQNLTATGTYYDTLQNVSGCDSIITLNLTVHSISGSTLNANICAGDFYNFNGQSLTSSGTYYDTLQNVNNCDSIIALTLTLLGTSSSVENASICSGDTFNFNGELLTQQGTYTDSLLNQQGCDSIVTLNLQFYPAVQPTPWNATMCQGDTFQLGNQYYTTTGNYTYAFQSMYGCDSVVNLNLTVDALPVAAYTTNCFANNPPIIYSCGYCGTFYASLQNSDSVSWEIHALNGSLDSVINGVDTIALSGGISNFCTSANVYIQIPLWQPVRLCLTAYNTCGISTQCDTVILDPEGISETPLNNFQLYPNPAKDYVTIVAEQSAIGGELQVRDVTGRLVRVETITAKQFTLNTSTLAAGTYVITLQEKNGGIGVKRLVIE